MPIATAILSALSDAYLQVGVWVASMVWICGWLRERPNGRFAELLTHRSFAPWVGALLGVSPGCGGAVVVMPLYVSGKTTFGAVIATLVATMGDSSFVMLAARPKLGLLIHLGLFVLGGLCGTLVDRLGIRVPAPASSAPRSIAPPRLQGCTSVGAKRLSTGLLYEAQSSPRLGLLAMMWGCMAVGLALSIALSFFRMSPELLGSSGGVLNLHIFGALAALPCLALALLGWSRSTAQRVYPGNRYGLAIEALHETAPVVLWVALSFLITGILVDGLGLDLAFLREGALWSVCLGAVVGLIPGCGPQIVLTGLYIDGVVGLPVLLANAVSQDGDALLPLIAKHPRAASRATLITTIPALLVGLLAWACQRSF